MANRVFYIDDVTGKGKLGLPPSAFGAVTFVDTDTINFTIVNDELTANVVYAPPFVDEDFELATPASTITLAKNIEETTLIDVFINGLLVREGASRSYLRDTINNEIEFNSPVGANAWVRVRIHA